MGAKRILVVEDEEEIAEILALVLRSAGYTVDIAGTVAQARQRLDAREYTLVNTDLRLPDGDGLEIADCAAARRHVVLTKPMRPSYFLAAVERLIGPAHSA
jgi:two-component system response regulator PilR (NtrC family)